jgi:SAM-dependent methyltransferase
MKQKLSAENPFGYTPKGLAFELIKQYGNRGAHLDYGTYNGAFVKALGEASVISRGVGVDVNAEVVLQHKQYMPSNVSLEVIQKNAPLRFGAGEFDSISILGVIEHVKDQERLLRQLVTALKPGGLMIIAVPGQHAFSWLDMGNFKFRFPRLHRVVYTLMHSKEEYRQRYIECRNGLFGDIEVEKMWHEHFSMASMAKLLDAVQLKLKHTDGQGFFQRILINIAYFFGGQKGLMKPLIDADAKWFSSCELVFVAQKSS